MAESDAAMIDRLWADMPLGVCEMSGLPAIVRPRIARKDYVRVLTLAGAGLGVPDLEAEVERLREDVTARDFEIESLGKENERLAEMLAKGVYIESATMQPEHYNIRTRGIGAMLLAEKLVMFFKASGGENFTTSTIEMEFTDPKECERYALTIQKLDGEDSPAQKLDRQGKRIAELEETLLPFSEFARRNDEESNAASSGLPDSAQIAEGITLGDLRRARAVLGNAPKEDG